SKILVTNVSAAVNEETVIDGSVNPEMIPDRVAQSLFLRLVSSYQDTNKGYIYEYLKQVGRENCCDSDCAPSFQDADIENILSAA
ncbi:hypothetical protein OFM36_35845, partial [Escherichia coli]|nr:hypothetical protein [Escherichia coli]